MEPRFAVLGAGNGGQAIAGDLVLRGFRVEAVYDRYPEIIEPIRQQRGINLVGKIMEGFAPIPLATTDIGEAINSADVLLVVVPAFAHEYIAESAAPYLRDGQTVVLCPGYPGGSLVFYRSLKNAGCTAKVQLGETMILPIVSRLIGPATVGVRAQKRWVEISALPATETAKVVDLLKPSMPHISAGPNVFATGLNNSNPMIHVATTLLNYGRFESSEAAAGGDFQQWISPTIARINELMDRERLAVVEALGFEGLSMSEYARRTWFEYGRQVVEPQGPIPASSHSFPARYVTEDVPMGLVPMSELGDLVGIPTPTIDLMIDLACLVRQVDYRKEGRTLSKMGIGDSGLEHVMRLVNTGEGLEDWG